MTAPNRGRGTFLLSTRYIHPLTKKDTKICPTCLKEVPSNVFTIHQQSHFNENRNKAVKCEICNERFSNFFYRTKHVQAVHLKQPLQQCGTCGLHLKTHQEVNRHKTDGVCKYSCRSCSRQFPTEEERFDHQLSSCHHSMVAKKEQISVATRKYSNSSRNSKQLVICDTKVAMQQVADALAKAKKDEEETKDKLRLENELRKKSTPPVSVEGDFRNFEIVEMDSIPDLDASGEKYTSSSSLNDFKSESETSGIVGAKQNARLKIVTSVKEPVMTTVPPTSIEEPAMITVPPTKSSGNQLATSSSSLGQSTSTPKILLDSIRSISPSTDIVISEGSRDRTDPVGALKLLVSSATESLLQHTGSFGSDSGPKVDSEKDSDFERVMTDSADASSNDATLEKSSDTRVTRTSMKDPVTVVRNNKSIITPPASLSISSLGFKIIKNTGKKEQLRDVIGVADTNIVLKSPTSVTTTTVETAKTSGESVERISSVASSTEQFSSPSKVKIVNIAQKDRDNTEKSPSKFKIFGVRKDVVCPDSSTFSMKVVGSRNEKDVNANTTNQEGVLQKGLVNDDSTKSGKNAVDETDGAHDSVDGGAKASGSRRESTKRNLKMIGRNTSGHSYIATDGRRLQTKDSSVNHRSQSSDKTVMTVKPRAGQGRDHGYDKADTSGANDSKKVGNQVGQVFARTLGNGRIVYTTRKSDNAPNENSQKPFPEASAVTSISSDGSEVLIPSASEKAPSTITVTDLPEKSPTVVLKGSTNAGLSGELQKKITVVVRPRGNETRTTENANVPSLTVSESMNTGNVSKSCLTPSSKECKLKSFSLQPVYCQPAEAGSSKLIAVRQPRIPMPEDPVRENNTEDQKVMLRRNENKSVKGKNHAALKIENEESGDTVERMANLLENNPNLARHDQESVRNTLLLLKQKLLAKKSEEKRWRERMSQNSQCQIERWMKESEETQRQINLLKDLIRPDGTSKKRISYEVTEDPDTKIKILKPVLDLCQYIRVPPEPEFKGWKTTNQPAKTQPPILAKRNVAIFCRDRKRKALERVEPKAKCLKKNTDVQKIVEKPCNMNPQPDDLRAVMNELAVRFPERKKIERNKSSRPRRRKSSKLPREEATNASAAKVVTSKGSISVVSNEDTGQNSNFAQKLKKQSVYNYDPKTRNYCLTSEGETQVITESWDMTGMNDMEIKEELPWDLDCVKIERVEDEDMVDAMDLGEYVDSVMMAERETMVQT